MMGTYLALGRQWMRTSLAMVDHYRVTLGVIRWTAERRVDGCHNVYIMQALELLNDTGVSNLPRCWTR